MLRAAVTLVGTAVGVGAVLSYQPSTGSDRDQAAAPAATVDTTTPAATVTVTAGASPGVGLSDPTTTTSASTWVDGDVVPVQWGDVQVRVQLEGTRITDVQTLAMPDADAYSTQLSEQVRTTLREEVLQAQSADVDMVSGATYSSRAYLKSLQSALDRQ
jgi:uncharacterized protein with FMN-binding domain